MADSKKSNKNNYFSNLKQKHIGKLSIFCRQKQELDLLIQLSNDLQSRSLIFIMKAKYVQL